MARRRSTLEVIPSARRLIKSLREIGYDFKLAVADLVDNSIEAGASTVTIDMEFDAEDSYVRIADDGTGMDSATITEAMRFGSERDYEADELGKFGLGLKTASLSQCSCLTVASRKHKTARRIEARQWDLEHVEQTNRWEILRLSTEECSDVLVEPLAGSRGTVVFWEELDRVLGYKNPWGDRARTGFLNLAEELERHLGMVFHRFLTGEARRRKKLKITLNGNDVEAWDPFARSEKATLRLPRQEFELWGDEGAAIVGYTPYVLPSQFRFSSPKAFNHFAGPGKWNYQQGLYIYRADRMIQSGGWSYMRTSDEHTKLARVALDFRPELDSVFLLNVAKARISLPPALKSLLRPHIEELVKQARKSYKPPSSEGLLDFVATARKATTKTLSSGWGPSGEADGQTTKTANPGDAPSTAGENRRRIGLALQEAAANAGESASLRKIRKALKERYPDIASEIGW